LALAGALGLRPLVAHYHLGLGTLYQPPGLGQQALAELAVAAEMYGSMDITGGWRTRGRPWSGPFPNGGLGCSNEAGPLIDPFKPALDKRLHGVATLGDAPSDHSVLVAEASSGQAEFEPEFGEVIAAQVAEFDPLQQIPDTLIRVQLGRVGWQPFQPDAGCATLSQEVLDDMRAVDWGAVPDDQQLARDMAEQVLQKAHHVRPAQRAVLHLQEELTGRGDAADDG
jgi:hypothetical protein